MRNNHGDEIVDRSSFDLVFMDKINDGIVPEGLEKLLNNEAAKRYASRFDKNVKEDTFKEAGGKNLRQDKLRRASVVTQDREEFKRRGAQNIDFERLDTPSVQRGRVVKAKKQKPKKKK